jgi:vitamin B12 transporter
MKNCSVCLLMLGLLVTASMHGEDSARPTSENNSARVTGDGTQLDTEIPETERIVVSATRFEIPLDQSPATVSEITAEDIEIKQIDRVAEALREVPGLSIVETGTPGQLTSVFTRGLNSGHTQILLNGVPINQGLSGAFNFADLTTDNIGRIEIARGPQSTIYGPRALAGVIQLFTKEGGTPTGLVALEGGSFGTFRERAQSAGKIDKFDYSFGASRIDTDNDRPNNEYRNTAAIANIGWSPDDHVRIASLFTYSNSDAGSPNSILTPRPVDNLLTERWLIAPSMELRIEDWWDHKIIFSYDHERQVNDPNNDGFVFATRSLFKRFTLDYQNDLRPASWLTVTSGVFYSQVDAGQERPFILFGEPPFLGDHTEQTGVFLQTAVTPIANLILVGGGRLDHFNESGDVWTYRFAGSYKIDKTNTTLHSSVATGFSPPSSQDKLFRFNPDPTQPLGPLEPEEVFGWDVGVEQRFCENKISIGATYFYNDLSNVIGFDGLFQTLNLGAARTQGIELEMHARPIPDLILSAAYTYLDTEKTSSADINQLQGARLPRRPRNEVYVSASYLWFHKLRTTLSTKFVNAREEINFGGPNSDIEDYAVVNFAAEYEINPHLSVFGRVDNLLDEQYAEVFGYPNLGLGAYGGIKLRF